MNVSELIEKYKEGTLSDSEYQALLKWIKEDPANLNMLTEYLRDSQLFDSVYHTYSEKDVLRAVQNGIRSGRSSVRKDMASSVRSRIDRIKKKKRAIVFQRTLLVAAMLLVSIAGFLIYQVNQFAVHVSVAENSSIMVNRGNDSFAIHAQASLRAYDILQVEQTVELLYPDQSTVTIERGRYQVYENGGLLLSGLITCQITERQTGDQFQIETADGRVEVIGTQFTVEINNGTQVRVSEGRVRLRDESGQTIELVVGEAGLIDAEHKQLVKNIDTDSALVLKPGEIGLNKTPIQNLHLESFVTFEDHIRIPDGKAEGYASGTFVGESGNYDIGLYYYDENGDSRYEIIINDVLVSSWSERYRDQYVAFQVLGGVALKKGDEIKIYALRKGKSRARVGSLHVTPALPEIEPQLVYGPWQDAAQMAKWQHQGLAPFNAKDGTVQFELAQPPKDKKIKEWVSSYFTDTKQAFNAETRTGMEVEIQWPGERPHKTERFSAAVVIAQDYAPQTLAEGKPKSFIRLALTENGLVLIQDEQGENKRWHVLPYSIPSGTYRLSLIVEGEYITACLNGKQVAHVQHFFKDSTQLYVGAETGSKNVDGVSIGIQRFRRTSQ